ncbi:substrate-binding domain-containing protein [Bermanella sp. R86510]|uniref:substrate-binding domain-containing protein n=1 Tax=unclassified Bermanella TaxID=2627862 RepID=UPI0037CB0B33
MKRCLSLICCLVLSVNVLANLSVAQETRLNASLAEVNVSLTPFQNLPRGQEHTLLRIHGSNTIGESLAPSLAAAYLKAKGAQNIQIQNLPVANERMITGDLPEQGKRVSIYIAAHGSSTGFKRLLNGEADLWAASRAAKAGEIEKGSALGNLRAPGSEHVVAIDGLAIIVNPNNSVSALSKKQVGQIFSGEVDNWSQLGGPNRAISLYARDNKSGTWDSFKSMVLAGEYSLHDQAYRFESSDDLVNNVLADPGAIGFVGLGFIKDAKLVAVSDGPAQAFRPSTMTVATEDYALSRRLFLYSAKEIDNPYAREFLQFSQGVQGQEIVSTEGFISQNVEAMQVALTEDVPTDYRDLVDGAKRLSVNFRFKEGSATLDNKAQKDILRLVHYMQQHPESELVLIGFGDKRKNAGRSQLLSKLRAMAVRRELARLGIYPDVSKGYGDYNPVAAFERGGATKNRRVEVWLR